MIPCSFRHEWTFPLFLYNEALLFVISFLTDFDILCSYLLISEDIFFGSEAYFIHPINNRTPLYLSYDTKCNLLFRRLSANKKRTVVTVRFLLILPIASKYSSKVVIRSMIPSSVISIMRFAMVCTNWWS